MLSSQRLTKYEQRGVERVREGDDCIYHLLIGAVIVSMHVL